MAGMDGGMWDQGFCLSECVVGIMEWVGELR